MPDVRVHPNQRVVAQAPPGFSSYMKWRPGDFILCRAATSRGATTALGKAIQAGERTRYGNTDFARWTHMAMVVSESGDLVEAIESGVKRTNVEKYRGTDYFHVSPIATAEQRRLAVAFCETHEGAEYGIVNFVGLVGQSLFGENFPAIQEDSQFICSGLGSRATEKYIASYQRAPEDMMPADVAYFWHVESGEPLPAPGWFGRMLDRLATVCRMVTRL